MKRCKRTRATLVALSFIIAIALASCESEDSEPVGSSLPRRVVTFSPAITESVFALGGGELVVGVAQWSNYPPEALTRKVCGGAANPNFEALLSLAPDLVIVQGESRKVSAFCKEQRIPFLRVTVDSVSDIKSDLLKMGEALGLAQEANTLVASIEKDLREIRSEKSAEERPRVFLTIGRTPGAVGSLLTAGGETFFDEMIVLAGGRNIFADREGYPTVSKESLILLKPDVILELRPGEELDEARLKRLAADWEPLQSIPAIRNGRVVTLTDALVQIPGPRVVQIARIFKDAIE